MCNEDNLPLSLSAPKVLFYIAVALAMFVAIFLGACTKSTGGTQAVSADTTTSSEEIVLEAEGENEGAATSPEAQSPEVQDSASGNSMQGAQGHGLEESVQAKLASMTLEEKVAQMFVVRAESLCSDGSTLIYVDDDVRANLEAYPIGGVALLGDNFVNEDQARALSADLQEASQEYSGLDLLLCVDEEGGTVARIGSNPAFPQHDSGDMRTIGETGNVQAAYDAALHMGSYLRDLGYNADYAPVADVDNPTGGTMYYRSFGSVPSMVASMVESQVMGFKDAGVLCCAKHFPGIGSAVGDSHETGIQTLKTLDEMREEDLPPFQAAIDAGVPMVMVGHISCPNVTGNNLPATFSPDIVTGILRDEMHFEGVVVTDALGMGAATENYGDSEAAVRAIEAGVDLVLMPTDFAVSYRGVMDALSSGTLTEERIDESVARIIRMKLQYEGME